jgi:glutaredoxin-like protein NrdH
MSKESGIRVNNYILYSSMLCQKIPPARRIMKLEHENGRDAGKVLLFALSTCGWCQKTKNLLKGLGIAFDYVYVDLLPADEMRSTLQLVEKYNPAGSFPTLVINDTKTIVGFREEDIRGALRV